MTGHPTQFQPFSGTEEFNDWTLFSTADAIAQQIPRGQKDDREPIRILVIGSKDGCNEIVHQLHNLHFREATSWSPLLPTPTPGIYLRINVHYRLIRPA